MHIVSLLRVRTDVKQGLKALLKMMRIFFEKFMFSRLNLLKDFLIQTRLSLVLSDAAPCRGLSCRLSLACHCIKKENHLSKVDYQIQCQLLDIYTQKEHSMES